ncbi:MAG TPA: hypothetical protein VG367_19325 [Mucilaginibacter sp.]|jgi:hypothetical protein|nr:hypothetical protein [Mucilaginibacter sp.]
MKKLLFILIPIAFCLFACVHEGDQTVSVTKSGGGSFNPVLSSDSGRNLASGTATGPTGLTKNPDTIPQPFAIPNSLDTSQKKNLNPPH